jgi:hypothetical protein
LSDGASFLLQPTAETANTPSSINSRAQWIITFAVLSRSKPGRS